MRLAAVPFYASDFVSWVAEGSCWPVEVSLTWVGLTGETGLLIQATVCWYRIALPWVFGRPRRCSAGSWTRFLFRKASGDHWSAIHTQGALSSLA